MTEQPQTTFATIAEAEKAITDAGYRRDSQRHVWVSPISNTTVKVVRDNATMKFYLQKA